MEIAGPATHDGAESGARQILPFPILGQVAFFILLTVICPILAYLAMSLTETSDSDPAGLGMAMGPILLVFLLIAFAVSVALVVQVGIFWKSLKPWCRWTGILPLILLIIVPIFISCLDF